MNRRLLLAAGLLTGLTTMNVVAQPAAAVRVRGTIAALQGNALTVNSRDGQKLEIVLNDPLAVLTVKKVDLGAIAANDYVGVATRADAAGKLTALAVVVFPEANRGVGEGYGDWDLEPGSKMTNGTVKGAVTVTSGRELSIGYKGASNTILVPPNAPVVTSAPAERADVKAGVPVFVSATKNAEGKLATGRVVVGKDGVAPPM